MVLVERLIVRSDSPTPSFVDLNDSKCAVFA